MAAAKGNKYAEKWTKEATLNALSKVLKEASKPSCDWLGDALDRCDLYPQIWSYWLEKFADDPEVFEAIKRIEGKMENKVVKNALKGDANATISIFVLKNKHDWKDKTEADVNVRKSYGAMSDEELEAEYERLEAISKAGTKED